MKTPESLKAHLETCRRLGVRYVSLARSVEGVSAADKTAPLEAAVESPQVITAVAAVISQVPPLANQGVEGKPGLPPWLTVSGETIEAMELMAFDRDICECQKCPLGATRKKFVFGSGNPRAEVMFIGEAPGADEDSQGLPFVGRAGQLLTKIVESTQAWKRSDVFICNVLKCRPPGNRTPLPEEVEQCRPYLEEQIRVIQPKLLMALGASAAQALLRTKDSVGKLRNKWHEFQGIPLRVTYHPAALLRFDGYKKDVWEDMKEFTAKYQQLKGK
jgi:uracil-DNA glycosylase